MQYEFLPDDFPHRDATIETLDSLRLLFNFPDDPPDDEIMAGWATTYADMVDKLADIHAASGKHIRHLQIIARINLSYGLISAYASEVHQAQAEAYERAQEGKPPQ